MSKQTVTIYIDLADLDQDKLQEYVYDNFSVGDVFSDKAISNYAKDNLGVFDVYDEDDIRKGISDGRPEDYFPEASLTDWANRNGWKGPN
jgi:hypothetical protein